MASAGNHRYAKALVFEESSDYNSGESNTLVCQNGILYFNGKQLSSPQGNQFDIFTANKVTRLSGANIQWASNLVVLPTTDPINNVASAGQGFQSDGEFLYYNGIQISAFSNIYQDTQPLTSNSITPLGNTSFVVHSNLIVDNVMFANTQTVTIASKTLHFSNIDKPQITFDATEFNFQPVSNGTNVQFLGALNGDGSDCNVNFVSSNTNNLVGTDVVNLKFKNKGDSTSSTTNHTVASIKAIQSTPFNASQGGGSMTLTCRNPQNGTLTADTQNIMLHMNTQSSVANTIVIAPDTIARVGIMAGYVPTYRFQVGSNLYVDDGANKTIGLGDRYKIVTPSNVWFQGTSGDSVTIGSSTQAGEKSIVIGAAAGTAANIVSIGFGHASVFLEGAIRIGTNIPSTTSNTISIGRKTKSGIDGVSIGSNAGTIAAQYSISIGDQAGAVLQSGNAVAIGRLAGNASQESNAVAIGVNAGNASQKREAVAIGAFAGASTQSSFSVAVGVNAGRYTQGLRSVAIGAGAGEANQESYAVAVGNEAGYTGQYANTIAIGNRAGRTSQNVNSIAFGLDAGNEGQYANSVAIGMQSGKFNQHGNAIAIGMQAGYNLQDEYGIAMGFNAGYSNQGEWSVAIGMNSGRLSQNNYSVSVGAKAGESYQGSFAVAIGMECATSNQKDYAVAVGVGAGYISQDSGAVSIGWRAGRTSQGPKAVAIGQYAGKESQNVNAVSIGYYAGESYQDDNSVAVGFEAGRYGQNVNSVAIGSNAASLGQQYDSVAIGYNAGSSIQKYRAVAIGPYAGRYSQNNYTVAMGESAGASFQGSYGVSIGAYAGISNQDIYAIAIGSSAGRFTQGVHSIAIGTNAGYNILGDYSTAIGDNAGYCNQGNQCTFIGNLAGYNGGNYTNSICINAKGEQLNPDRSNGCFIKPIRPDNSQFSNLISYHAGTGELKHTTKTFVIDHPDDKEKYLVHGCLEGPEGGVYYRGRGEVGRPVMLPKYVPNLIKGEPTIQITPIYNGSVRTLNCSEYDIKTNSFEVFGSEGPFYWTFTAKRCDVNVEPLKAETNVNGNGPYLFTD